MIDNCYNMAITAYEVLFVNKRICAYSSLLKPCVDTKRNLVNGFRQCTMFGEIFRSTRSLTFSDLLQSQHILRADRFVPEQFHFCGYGDSDVCRVAALLDFHGLGWIRVGVRLSAADAVAVVAVAGVSAAAAAAAAATTGINAAGLLRARWVLAVACAGTRIAHYPFLLLHPLLPRSSKDTKQSPSHTRRAEQVARLEVFKSSRSPLSQPESLSRAGWAVLLHARGGRLPFSGAPATENSNLTDINDCFECIKLYSWGHYVG